MSEGEDVVELKFRLGDGSDLGPFRYNSSLTVAVLKERIVSDWPKDKKVIPKIANDVKLISSGKILENSQTIAQCRTPFSDLPGGVMTMHVVIQPSLTKAKTEKKVDDMPNKTTDTRESPSHCKVKLQAYKLSSDEENDWMANVDFDIMES